MDDEVQAYIDAIDPANRPLFDRVHRLVLEASPQAQVVWSYKMPTYVAGTGKRLHVGVWKHGVSLYGWVDHGTAGFVERHPELVSGAGTIRIRPVDAEGITDDEFRALAAATLGD